MSHADSTWKVTRHGVSSSLLVLLLDAIPVLLLLFGGFRTTNLWIAGFFALACWPASVPVVRRALKTKELPRITGGPGVSWDGKTYGPGYRRFR